MQALAKYAVFSGRACCRELWVFMLINAGVIYALDWPVSPIVLECYMFFLLLPTLALWVRRLHDFNLHGWWLIPWLMAPIIMVIGAYYLEEIQFPVPANVDLEMLDQPCCGVYPLLAVMIACPLWLIAFMIFLSLPGALDVNSFGQDPRMVETPNNKNSNASVSDS